MTSTAAKRASRIVIVVGVDLTDVSAHLVEQASALVRTVDESEVHVVHVVKPEPALLRVVRPAEDKDAGAVHRVEHAQEVLERLCSSLQRTPGVKVVVHTPVGDPATQLARIAEDVDAHMLVIEAHTHPGQRQARVFPRSLVDQVTGMAPCTVLALRARPTSGGLSCS